MRNLITPLSLLGASLMLGACTDLPTAPTSHVQRPALDLLTAPQVFARYVAMGTSNSQGVRSAGIDAAGQRAAWPAELARRAGAPMSLPLIQDPGCSPPLLPPLVADMILVGAFGNDLVTSVMNLCMPLRDGITPPTNSVAISGAKARDALRSTPESEAAHNARTGVLYSRVLAPGQTQVAAMLAQNPTFVSVELAANEVLPASTGRPAAMTPYAEWESDYDQIVGAVTTTGARAVLVGVPSNAANFPSIRKAREFFNEWPTLLGLGITVSLNCYFSSNYIFVPGYVLGLISKTPTTATCSNVPDAIDYVLTASEMSAINTQMAKINAHIQAKATENGYAYFSLGALYDLPKPKFSVYNLLFSNDPFGSNISLDGVHPSASGQAILATAAAQAINARYGLAMP